MKNDVDIYTDGSGTIADMPCGYATCIIHNEYDKKDLIFGCDNGGSNNYAELMAIFKALYYLRANYDYNRYATITVHSDSQWSINVLNGLYMCGNDAGLTGLVKGILELAFLWRVEFMWVSRNSNPHNTQCDKIAGKLRKQMIEFNKQNES